MATKSALPKLRVKWLSRTLKNLQKNAGVKFETRKKKTQAAFRALLAAQPYGQVWKIPNDGFEWKKLPDKRYNVTVFLKWNSSNVPGGGDAPVPAPKQPSIGL